MDLLALLKLFQSWGPSAISSALIIVVMYLVKELHKNNKADEERAQSLRNMVDSKLKELRENTAKVLDEHGRRISSIELEYVKREEFYRDLGGWKDDISRLSDKLSVFSVEINRNIIELWKGRKDQ